MYKMSHAEMIISLQRKIDKEKNKAQGKIDGGGLGIESLKKLVEKMYKPAGWTGPQISTPYPTEMPDKPTIAKIVDASYERVNNTPTDIDGWELVRATPTLKFYKKADKIIVGIRGTADVRDVRADIQLVFDGIHNTARFKEDVKVMNEEYQKYAHQGVKFYGVGHSLGGAILDAFIKAGFLRKGVSYNPAVEKLNLDSSRNYRIYMENDPLYNIMGQYAKIGEVRKQAGPGGVATSVKSHLMSNFRGGDFNNFLRSAVGIQKTREGNLEELRNTNLIDPEYDVRTSYDVSTTRPGQLKLMRDAKLMREKLGKKGKGNTQTKSTTQSGVPPAPDGIERVRKEKAEIIKKMEELRKKDALRHKQRLLREGQPPQDGFERAEPFIDTRKEIEKLQRRYDMLAAEDEGNYEEGEEENQELYKIIRQGNGRRKGGALPLAVVRAVALPAAKSIVEAIEGDQSLTPEDIEREQERQYKAVNAKYRQEEDTRATDELLKEEEEYNNQYKNDFDKYKHYTDIKQKYEAEKNPTKQLPLRRELNLAEKSLQTIPRTKLQEFKNVAAAMERKKAQEEAYIAKRKGGGEAEDMEGEGFFGDVADKVKHIFGKSSKYNNISTKTLNEYGSVQIKQLTATREKIQKALNLAMNLISSGKFGEATKQLGYDDLYHIRLYAEMENGKLLLIEKNEVIYIQPTDKIRGEPLPINYKTGSLTLQQLMDAGQKFLGNNFFLYDAFNNNCASFVVGILKGNKLWSDANTHFLAQDVSALKAKLPGTSAVSNFITSLGAIVSRIQGKGEKQGGYYFGPTHHYHLDAVHRFLEKNGITNNMEVLNAALNNMAIPFMMEDQNDLYFNDTAGNTHSIYLFPYGDDTKANEEWQHKVMQFFKPRLHNAPSYYKRI